jgi:two-component system, chemotaxis family, CheB/CheR fusion protein
MSDLSSPSSLTPPEEPPVNARFPVVAVGASAGGLGATTELLQQLGTQPGMAVVIVHHLDPAHDSSLVEILARATAMPVHAISDGMRVELDHVYVIPPNVALTMSDGQLRLSPRVEERGLHLPIDRFMESLADDQRGGAIGVLLSGSGSDGSVGIRAIKAAGGITLAQNSSARYGSMPESAIATGCVDFVLSPTEIASELLRLGERPPAASAFDSSVHPDAPEFRALIAALRMSSSIDFANYKPATILRRAQRRMLMHRLFNLREYVELLGRDNAEVSALCEDVLIHVTGFFRDPATFEALTTHVFPQLLAGRPPGAPLRIWVAGCSTGEEVYSLAICLLEFLANVNAGDVPIKLFGTDASAHAIERARSGKYAEGIQQQVSPARLEAFFSNIGGSYQIRKNVRDLCVFARHDATRDPPFLGVDLISCRNLIIYLGSALQARLMAIFHYALKETGFLLLGNSETTHSAAGFVALDEKNKIYQRTAASSRLPFDFAGVPFSDGAVRAVPRATPAPGPLDVHREADRIVLAQFAPPGMVVTEDLAIVQFRGKTAPYLDPVSGIPSLDLLRMVREELRLPLRRAIDEARSKHGPIRQRGVRLAGEGGERVLEIAIVPLMLAEQRFFIVLFKDVTAEPAAEATADPPGESAVEPAVVAELKRELSSTRQYLESTVEQLEAGNEELKAANEEITSSNEELRSTNEELQMAKEELEASNEEMRSLNEEMVVRTLEATRLSDDLSNVLSGVEIPIVLLGRDSKIRRFAPAATRVLGLTAADIGRPLGEVGRCLASAGAEMAADVLARIQPAQRTLPDEEGHWYQLNARPYLTLDRRIDGTLLSAFDVDAIHKAGDRLREAQRYAESIVDTVSECLLVIDAERRVRSGNRAFYQTFGKNQQAIVGRDLPDLFPAPVARALSESLDSFDQGQDSHRFRLQHVLASGESRQFLVTARRIVDTPLVLLGLEDISAQERAEALRRSESELRDVLTMAAEGILITDTAGHITFVNAAANAAFGYEGQELIGQSIDLLVPERLRSRHAGHRAAYLGTVSPRRMGPDRSLVGLRKDGTEVEIEVTLSPLLREGGCQVVSFISDVTERRATERRIREYQNKLQQMAFDAALTEERERRRIAADLHDRIGQSLALAQMKLKSLPVAGGERGIIDEATQLLAQSLIDTRTLIFDLSPPILYDLGLKEALSWLAEDLEKRWGLRIEVAGDDLPKGLGDTEAALVFRAVRELLTNVVKHAQSPSAKISLQSAGEQLLITVTDDGVGFDPDAAAQPSAQRGFGLFSVREQISRLGGMLEVESAMGRGTRVLLRLPLHGPGAAEGDSIALPPGSETPPVATET